MTETIEKRRTRKQAAIAALAGTALIGGLLVVDVANRPAPQVECIVDVSDRPMSYAMSEADYQAAEEAFALIEEARTAEKLAAGCDPKMLGYTI